jgi:hypothetical protein
VYNHASIVHVGNKSFIIITIFSIRKWIINILSWFEYFLLV